MTGSNSSTQGTRPSDSSNVTTGGGGGGSNNTNSFGTNRPSASNAPALSLDFKGVVTFLTVSWRLGSRNFLSSQFYFFTPHASVILQLYESFTVQRSFNLYIPSFGLLNITIHIHFRLYHAHWSKDLWNWSKPAQRSAISKLPPAAKSQSRLRSKNASRDISILCHIWYINREDYGVQISWSGRAAKLPKP